MDSKNIDLNKLKEEINIKKSTTVNHEPTGRSWLGKLVESVETGEKNILTEKINAINKRTDNIITDSGSIKYKENTQAEDFDYRKHIKNAESLNEDFVEKKPKIQQSYDDREELMYKKFSEKANNGGLYDSINNYYQNSSGGRQMNENLQPNNTNMITEAALKNITEQYLNTNVGGLLEELMRNTMVEMYEKERVKRVLRENPEIVKELVIDAIKEIQERQKRKQEQKK